uniref:Uncharacterized protein n=1 Tax=Psilocybe cubensis TaxID=181762 RepID=A0A8H7Y0J5_PSICU
MEGLGNTRRTPDSFEQTQHSSNGRRNYPAILHVAVISTFLIPIALFPYMAARRQIFILQRKIEMLEKDTQLFKDTMKVAIADQSLANAEISRVRESGQLSMERINQLQHQVSKQESERTVTEKELRVGLRQLLDETQHSRYMYSGLFFVVQRNLTACLWVIYRTQTATLRALGMSLADIAAFMQEVELNFGLRQRHDHRGIDRMRLLALRMQSLSQPEDHTIQVG